MIRIEKDSPLFNAINFVTNPIMGKTPKDELRKHILYCYFKDGKFMYTNGRFLSLAEVETPDCFENETFYEVLKRTKSEIILDKVETDADYPDMDIVTYIYPELDIQHPAGTGYINPAACFIVQKTGACFDVQAIINCLKGLDFGVILGKKSDCEPICIEEICNGYRNQTWIMPIK